MAPEAVERRLTAILSADVVGYSRLMAADEEATLRALTWSREQITRLVGQHRGRVVDAPGDNILVELPSALDATRCALDIQREMAVGNGPLPPERRMEFRIGIHLGDVMVEGERIYGDGVNIAARLESLAEPGGICISAAVHEQVRHKLDVAFADLGAQTVKNIPTPIRVFRMARGARPVPSPRRRIGGVGKILGAAGLLLALVGFGLWASWPAPMGWLLDWTGVSAPPVDPALPDKPSLVVLPFENMSGDPEQEYFADGITEDLTTELSRNGALFVISRNSAFTYKGRSIKIEDVGRELGVRYVLEGSVRRAGGRARITAQLIDATSGFHLWSERYDRELADIFEVQAELADKIQTALQVEIRDAELARVRRFGTDDLDAHDHMLRGLFLFERARRDSNLEARRSFARAFEIDPDFGAAQAMYGNTYAVEYNMGWNRDPALLERAEDAARRALELGDQTADALNTLGSVHLARREFEAAVASYEAAIEAEPSHDVPHVLKGVALLGQGRVLAALESMGRGMRLNPRSSPTQRLAVSLANYRAGRIDQAVADLEAARAENPIPRLALIRIQHPEGRSAEARRLAGEVRSINPELTAAEANRMVFGFEAEDAFRRAGLP